MIGSLPGDVLVAKGSANPALYCDTIVVRADKMNWIAGRPPLEIEEQLRLLRKNKQNNNNNNNNYNNNESSSSNMSSSNDDTNKDKTKKVGAFLCTYKARYLQPFHSCAVSIRLLERFERGSRAIDKGAAANTPVDDNNFMQMIENHDDTHLHSNPSYLSSFDNNSTSPISDYNQINIINTDNNYEVEDEVEVEVDDYELIVTLDLPQRAVTPGQILALYLGDECLGGGVISSPKMCSDSAIII